MKEHVSKVDIVCTQIEKACELHLNGEFVCSLSIGGSAESLTHELVEARGAESGESWHRKFIRFWREKSGLDSPSDRDILKEKRWARNSVKHQAKGESEEIQIDLELESFLVIKGAIENYQRLGNARTPSMELFNEQTSEYG